MPHDLNFLDEALLSFLLGVRGLLGKGLDCALAAVSDVFHEVNGSEVALSDLLDGPVMLMKGYLVEVRPQHFPPLLLIALDQLELLLSLLYEKVHSAILDHESQLEFEGQVLLLVLDRSFVELNRYRLTVFLFFPERGVKESAEWFLKVGPEKIFFHYI